MAHKNVAVVSMDENSKCAVALLSVAGGPTTSTVLGALVSTVHDTMAGVGSTWPLLDVAVTVNVCAPSAASMGVGLSHENGSR